MAKTNRASIDPIVLLVYLALAIFGFSFVYSSSYSVSSAQIFNLSTTHGKQLMFMGISVLVGGVILILDGKIFALLSYFIYGLSIVLLIAVMFLGDEINGARSWFKFGSFGFQPSEIGKLATGLALAKYISSGKVSMQNKKQMFTALGILFVPGVLVIMQGDFGSALVYFALALVLVREGVNILYFIGVLSVIVVSVLALAFNKWYLLIAYGVLYAAFLFFTRKSKGSWWTLTIILIFILAYTLSVDYGFNNFLKPHQKDRINVMLGKGGNDWNLRQSKIAIGSGGFFGKGFLKGTQTKFDFVPEQNTDFIFTSIAEELGFVGSCLLISLFGGLIYRITVIAERQRSAYSRIYGYAVATIIFVHVLINIGMTIGLMPVIGIPLPFISYGGSSFLSFSVLLFILLKLDIQRNDIIW